MNEGTLLPVRLTALELPSDFVKEFVTQCPGSDRGHAALEVWDRVVEAFIGGPPSTWLWRGLTDKRREYIRKVSSSSWGEILQTLSIGLDYHDCIVERSGRRIGNLTERLDTANWVLYNYHRKYGYSEAFFNS